MFSGVIYFFVLTVFLTLIRSILFSGADVPLAFSPFVLMFFGVRFILMGFSVKCSLVLFVFLC